MKFKVDETAPEVEAVGEVSTSGSLLPNKQFIYENGCWQKMTQQELLDMKIGDLLNGGRIMFEFDYEKTQYIICCNVNDYELIRLKYPKAVVILITDIIKLWTGHFTADASSYLFNMFPAILTINQYIPGAKVVRSGHEQINFDK